MESDFEVEQESGELMQFEPDYFNARAVLKRNSLQKDASLPNDSLFVGSVGSDSSKKYGSLPQSGMPIPTRWSNVSPENQYPNTGILFKSLHAFTPPLQQEALFQGQTDQSALDEIPFSGAYQFKSQSKKVIHDNASLFSASPPFAQTRAEVICVNKPAEWNTSITLARNPSLIFPSSPGLVMSSSPSLMPLLTSGSSSQPQVGHQQTPLNNPSPIDLGSLLSVLDRDLHLKPTAEANTTEFSDVSPISLQLDKFRKIGRTNQELVSRLRSQTETNVENNSIIEDAEMSGYSSKSRNVEWTTARESHTKYGSLLMSKVQGSHRRSKRRSTTTDGIFHDAAGAATRGMSQSEQFPARHDEDEDLLFNMSMIE